MWETHDAISSLAFHPVDQLLVIASFNELYFWDWNQPDPFTVISTRNKKERVRYVKFDAVGHQLITGIANWSHTTQRGANIQETVDRLSSRARRMQQSGGSNSASAAAAAATAAEHSINQAALELRQRLRGAMAGSSSTSSSSQAPPSSSDRIPGDSSVGGDSMTTGDRGSNDNRPASPAVTENRTRIVDR